MVYVRIILTENLTQILEIIGILVDTIFLIKSTRILIFTRITKNPKNQGELFFLPE